MLGSFALEVMVEGAEERAESGEKADKCFGRGAGHVGESPISSN